MQIRSWRMPAGTSSRPTSQVPRRTRTQELSVREVEVVQLAAAGLTNEEIAGRLFLSGRTIQSHVRTAMRKTEAKNRAELAAIAVRDGLVPEPANEPPEPPE